MRLSISEGVEAMSDEHRTRRHLQVVSAKDVCVTAGSECLSTSAKTAHGLCPLCIKLELGLGAP